MTMTQFLFDTFLASHGVITKAGETGSLLRNPGNVRPLKGAVPAGKHRFHSGIWGSGDECGYPHGRRGGEEDKKRM